MSRESLERVPALAAAAALHVGVLFLALLLGQWLNKPEPVGQVTSVTLMTSAQVDAARAAMQADQEQQAATPEPTPQAPEPPPAPVPSPTPAPAPPAPTSAPSKPTQVESAKVTQAQGSTATTKAPPKPTKPAPSMDFDALAKSLEASTKASGSSHSSANKGRLHASTSIQVHTGSGVSTAASDAAKVALGDALGRLWIRNCGVMGGSDTTIVVSYKVGTGGRLVGNPVSSEANTTDPLVKVASDRAIRAVYAYFSDPPPEAVNLTPDNYKSPFNPKQDCPK